MKKFRFTVVLTVILMLIAATQAVAGSTIDRIKDKKELVVGTNASFPPFAFKAKNGTIKGFDVDLANALATAMGVKLRVVNMNFEDLIGALEAQKVDLVISAMTMETKRNFRVAFVGPYFISGQALMLTKETAESVKEISDMDKADFSIAVPKGTTTEALARKIAPKAKIVAAANAEEALKLLLKNKVKALMADFPFCTVESFRYKDKDLVVTKPMSFEPLGMAVRGDDPLFVNVLYNFLVVVQGNGEVKAISQKWFVDPAWVKELP